MPMVSKSKFITLILRVQKNQFKKGPIQCSICCRRSICYGGSVVLKILLGKSVMLKLLFFINRWGCLEYGDIRPCNKCKIVKKYDNFGMRNQVKETYH